MYNNWVSKSPIINALSASGYIVLVVSVMNFIMQSQKSKPDTIAAPIIMLSMLTLSVTVMAYIFFYQPFQFFIEGRKREAVGLFVQTVGVFGLITVVVLFLVIFVYPN